MKALCELAALPDKTLVHEHELGLRCVVSEQTGYWLRHPKYRHHKGVAAFVADLTQEASRQTYDRRITMARVFPRTAVKACEEAGVHISVLYGLSGAKAQLRRPLIALAARGASTRALAYVRRIGEQKTSYDTEPERVARILEDAYKDWRTGKADKQAEKADVPI